MNIPRRSWFTMQPPSGLHGFGHVGRVMVWAAVLNQDTPYFERVVWGPSVMISGANRTGTICSMAAAPGSGSVRCCRRS